LENSLGLLTEEEITLSHSLAELQLGIGVRGLLQYTLQVYSTARARLSEQYGVKLQMTHQNCILNDKHNSYDLES